MNKILLLCDDYWHLEEIVEQVLSFLNEDNNFELDVIMDGSAITK